MNGIIFKCEIKSATTEALQDRLDTLIRTPDQERQMKLWCLLEETMNIECELSKRNALYPIYRFSKLTKDI